VIKLGIQDMNYMKNGQHKFIPFFKNCNVVQFVELWNSLIKKLQNKIKQLQQHIKQTKWLHIINNGKCHDSTRVAIMEISCTFVTSVIKTKKTLECNLCSVSSTMIHGHIAFYTPTPCAIIIFLQHWITYAIMKLGLCHKSNNINLLNSPLLS
jgi:hypothetical protein